MYIYIYIYMYIPANLKTATNMSNIGRTIDLSTDPDS